MIFVKKLEIMYNKYVTILTRGVKDGTDFEREAVAPIDDNED
jgi:hypothetical protein